MAPLEGREARRRGRRCRVRVDRSSGSPGSSAAESAGSPPRAPGGRRHTGRGPRLGSRRDRRLPPDGVEGAQAGGHLTAAAAAAGAGQPLRVALPRRPAAHGHQRVRALPAAGPPGHRRPAKPGPPAPRRRRHRARDRRRPLPARLRRDPRRPTRGDRRSPSSNARSPSTPSTASPRSD